MVFRRTDEAFWEMDVEQYNALCEGHQWYNGSPEQENQERKTLDWLRRTAHGSRKHLGKAGS